MNFVKSLLLFICLLFIYLFVVNATCWIDCYVASYRPSEPYCYLNDDGSYYYCHISVSISRLNGLTNNTWDSVRLAINVTNTVTEVSIYSQLADYKLMLFDAFRLFPQITYLVIRYNKSIVLYSTFSVLPKLKYLYMREVAFYNFPLFSILNRHLTYLMVYNHRILSVSRPLLTNIHFSGLSKLKYLSLYPLDRTTVIPSTFSGLPALTGLFIRNIQLMPNPISILSPIRTLKALGIYQFELTSIEFLKDTPFLFQLTSLYFWDNNITSFSDDLFTNYTKLKSLGIINLISVIIRSNFTKLGSIEHLSLQDNQITRIPHDTFQDMPLLTYIDLRYNPITALSSRVFEHQYGIRYIMLYGNKLHCNCTLQWLSIVSQKYGIYFHNSSCSTPTKYRGRSATDLSLYTNCTRDLSYDCFNRSVMCSIGSYCQDTIDSHLCVCEGEGVVFSKSLNRCVDFEKLIRASQGEFITDTNGYATFVPHKCPTYPTVSTKAPQSSPICPTTTTQSCPVNTCPICSTPATGG